ncbi:ComEC/Rec2 family competence protein [Nocardioides sp. zg-1228]|uniref:ComEC/Rec2 family competence protein n=1 Tax=Nocardioides sp. zg-1228 TaxID=2763008 RepID=UPI001642E739|nr:ComEC/Rec2 family competence protein [Nocardioides sp. zg-1228]MBC2934153.1 ComEC/Rec2 family competence protein [Nocardioides sp. zg-1228]QSF58898.1 ComEC/Rec2 family competence protein [Nocardioides sp. zg-1228]
MPDLRAVALGAGAWAGALLVLVLPARPALGSVALVTGVLVAGVGRRWWSPAWLGPLAALVSVAGVAALHHALVATSPLTALAAEGAVVSVRLELTSDVRVVSGAYGDLQVVRADATQVAGRGTAWTLDAPVVVMAGADWPRLPLGTTLETTARLVAADDDVAALVRPTGEPRVLDRPGPWWDAAAAVRRSVRDAVSGRGVDARELVPALVVGDDGGLDSDLADDFRTTGLTHLLAVSGTNLTLVVGSLLVLGRWVGVRGPWLYALGVLGIVGFVLTARAEPSVVRAAAMGTVALVGMGRNGLSRGVRGLGVAVLALLLVWPRLALTPGFALSALATAGILLLAPVWRDALMRWTPRWVAEAVSVPLAAQVACTPVVAALSGQVSLVAVGANLLAAPAVAPATVLGLAGGLLGLVWGPLGAVVAAPAAWSAAWIIAVARWGAGVPTAAVDWGTGPVSLGLLTLLCVLAVPLAPRVLGRAGTTLACTGLLVVVMLVRPPSPGWPPEGWVLAMCDVDQGDALVLRAGEHSAVVVDAGPEPAVTDACLDRLDVASVPLLVLTHFHADHVGGVAGVADGRRIDVVEGTALREPEAGARSVEEVTGRPAVPAAYGLTRRVGQVTLQAVWPRPGVAAGDAGESAANNASVVLLAEVAGVRILLTGDLEPSAQAALARDLAGVQVDVLKVPHHGSRHQDLDWLTSLGARLALVSVGEDNDYGHPAPDLLHALAAAGADVRRTDVGGDVVVVVEDGTPGVVGRG